MYIYKPDNATLESERLKCKWKADDLCDDLWFHMYVGMILHN